MKKIQLLFTALAILVAGAGVFASAREALATQYWRAPDANPNTPGNLCGAVISPPACSDVSGEQCSDTFLTKLPNEETATPKTYFISKTVDPSPDCVIVQRDAQ